VFRLCAPAIGNGVMIPRPIFMTLRFMMHAVLCVAFVCSSSVGFHGLGVHVATALGDEVADVASDDAEASQAEPGNAEPGNAEPGNAEAWQAEGVVESGLSKAVIIEFHEAITPLSGALLKRRFKQAVEDGAEIIVLDINSPGGYVSTTLELVEMLEAAEGVQTIAYIEREAISGAALLSLAANKIAIGPNALIGDAGMIMMGEDAAFRYVPEKERSYLAQRVRAIATKAGRPPSLAEAMVDKDLIVFKAINKKDGSVQYFSEREWKSMEDTDKWEKGKPVREAGEKTFFTATGARAVELGLADLTVANRGELAGVIGAIEPMPVLRGTWVDTVLLLLNSPFITWLLLVIGMVALVVEFTSPGIGVGGLISILCFGLFFWSRFLGGTSGWFEVILFLMGISFVLLEVFVIPGFGVAGISGGAMILFALVMASRRVLLPESVRDTEQLAVDILTVLGSVVGFFMVMMFVAKYLGEIPIVSRLALTPMTDDADEPVASLAAPGMRGMGTDTLEVGDVGRTQGPLRPNGRIRIGEGIFDVVSEGDFVEHDVEVKVVARFGNRIVVRQV